VDSIFCVRTPLPIDKDIERDGCYMGLEKDGDSFHEGCDWCKPLSLMAKDEIVKGALI
jgi:hypothetical protein